jgi:hypothetical protein
MEISDGAECSVGKRFTPADRSHGLRFGSVRGK